MIPERTILLLDNKEIKYKLQLLLLIWRMYLPHFFYIPPAPSPSHFLNIKIIKSHFDRQLIQRSVNSLSLTLLKGDILNRPADGSAVHL